MSLTEISPRSRVGNAELIVMKSKQGDQRVGIKAHIYTSSPSFI